MKCTPNRFVDAWRRSRWSGRDERRRRGRDSEGDVEKDVEEEGRDWIETFDAEEEEEEDSTARTMGGGGGGGG